MSLHDQSPFLTKPATNTLAAPAGEWGRQPIAGAYVDAEENPVMPEVLPLSAAQAAAMNFPGEEPEKPKRAPRAAAGTRTPRKRATAAAAEGQGE